MNEIKKDRATYHFMSFQIFPHFLVQIWVFYFYSFSIGTYFKILKKQ